MARRGTRAVTAQGWRSQRGRAVSPGGAAPRDVPLGCSSHPRFDRLRAPPERGDCSKVYLGRARAGAGNGRPHRGGGGWGVPSDRVRGGCGAFWTKGGGLADRSSRPHTPTAPARTFGCSPHGAAVCLQAGPAPPGGAPLPRRPRRAVAGCAAGTRRCTISRLPFALAAPPTPPIRHGVQVSQQGYGRSRPIQVRRPPRRRGLLASIPPDDMSTDGLNVGAGTWNAGGREGSGTNTYRLLGRQRLAVASEDAARRLDDHDETKP